MIITKKSVYKHYRRNPDGSLTYLGEVHYAYPEETMNRSEYSRTQATTEAMMNAALKSRRNEQSAFEELVDAAQEIGE